MHRARRIAAVAAGLIAFAVLAGGSLDADAAPQFFGSLGGTRLNEPVVAFAPTASNAGYYVFARDGGVFTFGDAVFRGSLGHLRLNAPIVDGAVSANGNGYYLAARDGGVFAFATAFHGSLGHLRLNAPITAMAAARDGSGYLLLGSDGGVFAFGSVQFRGSLAGQTANVPAVGIALRPQGDGYWIALANGRVFGFGAAAHFGDTGPLNAPIVSIEAAPDGAGYLLVASDGGVFPFGSTRFYGSAGGARLNASIVDAGLTATADGYWLLAGDGGVFTFPGTTFAPSGSSGAPQVLNERFVPPPSWPGPSNTGVPAGVTLTPHVGDMTITRDGTVIDGMSIDGHLFINARNVVVRRSHVHHGIRINAQNANALIEDTEIGVGPNGFDAGLGDPSFGEGITPGGYTCRRCNIHNFVDGARTGGQPVTIEDSWIHDLFVGSGHNDGIQRYAPCCSTNDVIRHNYIDCFAWTQSGQRRPCGTAAVFYAEWKGNLLLENNLLGGGGYALRIAESGTSIVRGNRFVRNSQYGPVLETMGVIEWTDNRFADNNQIIGR